MICMEKKGFPTAANGPNNYNNNNPYILIYIFIFL